MKLFYIWQHSEGINCSFQNIYCDNPPHDLELSANEGKEEEKIQLSLKIRTTAVVRDAFTWATQHCRWTLLCVLNDKLILFYFHANKSELCQLSFKPVCQGIVIFCSKNCFVINGRIKFLAKLRNVAALHWIMLNKFSYLPSSLGLSRMGPDPKRATT